MLSSQIHFVVVSSSFARESLRLRDLRVDNDLISPDGRQRWSSALIVFGVNFDSEWQQIPRGKFSPTLSSTAIKFPSNTKNLRKQRILLTKRLFSSSFYVARINCQCHQMLRLRPQLRCAVLRCKCQRNNHQADSQVVRRVRSNSFGSEIQIRNGMPWRSRRMHVECWR